MSTSPEPLSPSSEFHSVSWSLCNPTVTLKTDSKTLYTPSIVNTTRLLKEICVVKQQPEEQPQKSHKQDIHQKHLQIGHKLYASSSLCISRMQDAGCRGNKITAKQMSDLSVLLFLFSVH